MFFDMKTSEFLKKAAKIGCYFVSHGKEHDVWYSPVTDKFFRVPRHPSQEIRSGTLNSMMKDAGLK
jgi:predicted RNA binding protein YcfA (HicA-like mRNA interferase family)